ncbi:MAG: NADH-quinone oxidoreductase subunit NuoH [Deltaproteobacteria bacterium]|nr:NADH-quinone oxidoreductase subunit NuoH [Deltaproteobacteria bacterium]
MPLWKTPILPAIALVIGLALPLRASAARITDFQPDTVRLNSTLLVYGEGFGRGIDPSWGLFLDGKLISTDGKARPAPRVRIPAVRVSDEQVRAQLPRALVDAWTVSQARFEGTVSIDGPVKAAPLPVAFSVFPPDVLTLLTGFVGFANESSTMPPMWSILASYFALALFLLLVVFALFAGLTSWFERRVAGRMQNRIGPNRVGPQGVLQWLADGIKCFLKEDFIPPKALPILFRVGPYFAMLGVVLTLVTIPFGQFLVVSDLNVGVYYVLAVTGLVVVGILVGGFASANKWSLLGGFRAAAQIVSYEIPSGLAVATVVVLSGSLSFNSIVSAQGGFPWQWNLFHNPFTFVAFFFFFVASLAEGNRTPFDLPEAESELVSGYNTEYSGMRFVFYFFAEWGNLYIMSALMTALFLGGWQIPAVAAATQAGSLWLTVLGWALFTAKALFLVFVVIWLRWTLPRIRIDQLMVVCWKFLVPMGAVVFLGAAAWKVLVHGVVEQIASVVIFGLGMALAAVFVVKVVRTIRQGPMDFHINPFM